MTKCKSKPKAPDKQELQVKAKPDESREAAIARISVNPCWTAAAVSTAYTENTFGEQDVTETCRALVKQTERVNKGDMAEVEATLVAQAAALNSMFTNLARRASGQEYLAQFQAFMKLALRAQNQSRMTLETLATIKNPKPVAFVKQANLGQNVQVNNAARENEKPQPELSRQNHDGQPLDFGTPAQASQGDTAMEAVGTVHRAKDKGRQSKGEP